MTHKGRLFVLGVLMGLGAILLMLNGNPPNMSICVACFIRDTAGALNLHKIPTLQYVRPEVLGMVLGALLMALLRKEHRSEGGSSPLIRFVLGFVMMIGALVFLGCSMRMIIRMSGGDINAYIGLVGFVMGVGTGTFFLKKGFSLGRAQAVSPSNGYVLPMLAVLILALSALTGLFSSSQQGPGSMHAPFWMALGVGVGLGAIGQITRLCTSGSVRNFILGGDTTLLVILAGFFVTLFAFNLATDRFHWGIENQPIAHANMLFNALGLYVFGFAAILASGCPFRQLILVGRGSSDAATTVLGLFAGAAFAHNFDLKARQPPGSSFSVFVYCCSF